MAAPKAWAVIAGVGPGIGAAAARRFAKSYSVALLARNPANYGPLVEEINSSGGHAIGVSTDCSDGASVKKAFETLKSEFSHAHLAAAIYNVGGPFIRKPFLDLTDEEYQTGWLTNGLGGYHFSKAVLPLLLETINSSPEHPPTLIFTSASSSLRGSALFSSFSTGKFALRSLSQSLAREFGPQGIHVAHAIMDGLVDNDKTKDFNFDAPDAKIKPDSIADSYWYLHTQNRTAFTHEIDFRPYVEKW